jgi:hypothetical protein
MAICTATLTLTPSVEAQDAKLDAQSTNTDAQAAKEPVEKADAVVVRLYRDFAWQAVFAPRRDAVTFIDQPRAVLERYLEPELATLLLADRACVKKTKEICRLNMDPLFASQDTAAFDLEVDEPDAGNVVRVRYTYPGDGKKIEVRHVVVRTGRGWRIRDIRYWEGTTLRRMLGGKE